MEKPEMPRNREAELEWLAKADALVREIEAAQKVREAKLDGPWQGHLTHRPFAHLDGLVAAAINQADAFERKSALED